MEKPPIDIFLFLPPAPILENGRTTMDLHIISNGEKMGGKNHTLISIDLNLFLVLKS